MSGSQIAAEVQQALLEAGQDTGQGSFVCTFKRVRDDEADQADPWDTLPSEEPVYFQLQGLEDMREQRDMNGTFLGIQTRHVLVDATGEPPRKSDTVAVGVAQEDVTEDTLFEEIAFVNVIAPGGFPLMYEVRLVV